MNKNEYLIKLRYFIDPSLQGIQALLKTTVEAVHTLTLSWSKTIRITTLSNLFRAFVSPS